LIVVEVGLGLGFGSRKKVKVAGAVSRKDFWFLSESVSV
jgi:hypothetical protein